MVVAGFGLTPHFALPPPRPSARGMLPGAEFAGRIWALSLQIPALSHCDVQLPPCAYSEKLVRQPGAKHLLLEPAGPSGRREGLHFPTWEMLVELCPLECLKYFNSLGAGPAAAG